MTKRLIDVDDELVEQARAALGTQTLKDTVNESMAAVARAERRQRWTVEDLQELGRLVRDLGDPDVMRKAWE